MRNSIGVNCGIRVPWAANVEHSHARSHEIFPIRDLTYEVCV